MTFLLSALLLALIARPFNQARTEPAAPEPILRRTLGDIREGLAFLWRQRMVRTMTLVGFGNSLSAGAVVGLLVVYAVQALSLPETDGRIGQPFGAAVGGALAETLDVRAALLLVSVGVAASVAYGWFAPLREASPAQGTDIA